MTRIATIGVKYSSNLGDGVIAECLEHALRQADPAVEVTAIDLAGRRAFGDGLNRSRARVLTVLGRVPQPLRRLLVRLLLESLVRLKLQPLWRQQLAGCDAVILGGGQLFADTDLNFPVKIRACLRLVARAGLPAAVHGVGIGGGWSGSGRRMLRAAVANARVRAFAVRDAASQERARREFAGVLDCPVTLCPDPAVLVHEAYGVPLHRPGAAQRIGLCVAHPGVLSLHADAGPAAVPVADFYLGMVRVLAGRGLHPVCFTNGAGEDETFLREDLVPRLGQSGLLDRVTIARRPAVPRELVALIGGLDAVVAHRLHASIIAYGLQVPHVGLNWDSKVRSFFAEVGRSAFVVEPEDAVPDTVLVRLDRAIAEGIDPDVWQHMLARSRAAVAEALASLSRSVRAADAAGWRAQPDAAA